MRNLMEDDQSLTDADGFLSTFTRRLRNQRLQQRPYSIVTHMDDCNAQCVVLEPALTYAEAKEQVAKHAAYHCAHGWEVRARSDLSATLRMVAPSGKEFRFQIEAHSSAMMDAIATLDFGK